VPAKLPIRAAERNPDGSWRVEVDHTAAPAWEASPGELLGYLAETGARAAHLTGPTAHTLPAATLKALKAPWLRWTLHVPAHLYDPGWWQLADEITAHPAPGQRAAAAWACGPARARPVSFAHCPLA